MLPATRYNQPKVERISLRDWEKGIVTEFDEARTPIQGLSSAGNVMLTQDGTLRPRPSLMRYGSASVGTILGQVFEFVEETSGQKVTWEISMQNVSGTTRPYVRKDGGAWKATTGKTYDNSAGARYCQIEQKVIIMNGEDTLSYLDISTVNDANPTVVGYNAIDPPTKPSLARTGLSSGTFKIYYRITANSTVGETEASPREEIANNRDRIRWNPASDGITVTWTAVTDAKSYNVYMGEVEGEEALIAAGIEGLNYFDDGKAAKVVDKPAPDGNSTAGPAVKRGTVINGQIFLTGDKDSPYRVWFGGTTPTDRLNFSPFGVGSGYSEVGEGTKEFPVRVMPFRDGPGQPKVTVLCSGTNGSGKRYLMTPSTLNVGDQVIAFMEVQEANGQDGTDSPDAVILYDDSLWYPSLDGFKTTGTKPQLQNLLSTDRVSETIQKDVSRLNQNAMRDAVGLGFQGKLYWLVPLGSSQLNQIWILDLDRKGAWMKPWNVRASWMWLYRDSSGQTHHCVLVNNEVYEFTYANFTSDEGQAVPTSAVSGLIKFSEDGMEWGKLLDVRFIFSRPRGKVTVNVTGRTEDAPITTLGSKQHTSVRQASAWGGWGVYGWTNTYGWAVSDIAGSVLSSSREEVIIDDFVEDEANWFKWEINSRDLGVDYELTDVVAQFVRVGVKDLQ